MRRTLIGAVAAVFAGTVLIAAQDPAGQKDETKAQASVTQEKDKAVTYTGCLEAGATPGSFVLSNATEVKDSTAGSSARPTTPPQTPPTGANPPSPNPPSTAADMKGQSLSLQGSPVGFDLATNLNHKIQVTGTITELSAPARVEPVPEPGAPALKSFTVRSAKSLADRCTGQ